MPKQATSADIFMQINPDSAASEAFRSLRFNIEAAALDHGVKTITVTSSGHGEGKTTTAINLAVAYAQIGKRVVLIDADLRKPSIHLTLGGDAGRGLTNYLLNDSAVDGIIQDSYVDQLSVIPAGSMQPNPSELLASSRMSLLLDELRERFDIIFIDTPPLLTLTDAKIMSAKSDGVLLVIEHGKLKRIVAKKVKEELELAKANLLGIVMNQISSRDAGAYLYQ
ncbi:CpsD/CapB family tyrosine-protein kinase [Paenibacillus sp. NPDC056579]|uniref:CpsD/CapB family tyrosine-protein kinase n=1 Tax=Paenibacillus sp. NPDC056579 TaxID=3345871 RepID=UPI0036A26A08